jgi:hypothetical protein
MLGGIIKMLGVFGVIGILVGVLIGMGLVAYIKPTEVGGVGLLIALPTIFFALIGAIVGALLGITQKGKDKHNLGDEES